MVFYEWGGDFILVRCCCSLHVFQCMISKGILFDLQNCLDKINSSIKATVVLLKGLEGDKEAKGRKEKTESERKKIDFCSLMK